MKAKTDAREFLQKKYDEDMDAMVTGKSDIVEVVLESREVHPGGKAQAFFEGEFIEDRDGNDCEKLIWLPLSQIEVEENRDGTCTVQMPEWLALDKELI